MANSTILPPAVEWVDISGTSGGSSAVSITSLSGLNNLNCMILGMLDLDATVSSALHLEVYISGNSLGGSLVDRTGAAKANTPFNLRIYYARK